MPVLPVCVLFPWPCHVIPGQYEIPAHVQKLLLIVLRTHIVRLSKGREGVGDGSYPPPPNSD